MKKEEITTSSGLGLNKSISTEKKIYTKKLFDLPRHITIQLRAGRGDVVTDDRSRRILLHRLIFSNN